MAAERRQLAQTLVCVAVTVAALGLAGLALATAFSAREEQVAEDLAPRLPQQALAANSWALRFRPDLAAPWQERAVLLADDDPAAARAAVLAALRRDPRDWEGWQILGRSDFERNDLTAARSDFNQAARFDQGFDGHYQLANLALLLGDQATFWRELQSAVAMAPMDHLDFAINQALAFATGSDDPHLLALVPPARPEVTARIVEIYLAHHYYQQAAAIFDKMQCSPGQIGSCRLAAHDVVNALISAAFTPTGADASELARMAQAAHREALRRGWAEPVNAAHNLCADGNFRYQWDGRAYSWEGVGPVSLTRSMLGPAGQASAEMIHFDGQEPDETLLFRQLVPVEAAGRYSVSYLSGGLGGAGAPGLALEVETASGQILASLPAGSGSGWNQNQGTFSVPPGVAVVSLSFFYRRPSGQVRLRDPVLVGNVQLQGQQ